MTVQTIDNRGLEPPEPMVRIFAALERLSGDDHLQALMDREPMLIYAELERRGFTWVYREEGGPLIEIWRAK